MATGKRATKHQTSATKPKAGAKSTAVDAEAARPERPAVTRRKVVVIDDHPIVRERLAELINQESDLTVCGEAEDGPGAMSLIESSQPQIAIVDITLKDTYGIELIKHIKAKWPDLPVLILSMHDESMYGERALRAGAKGYLNKQEATQKVVTALRQVLAGQIFVGPAMAAGLLQKVARGGGGGGRAGAMPGGSPTDALTERETEIFHLLGEGKSERDIATTLNISVKTVEAHREHIKQKLSFKNSSELLRYAIESRIRNDA